jgi:hypothetical protein
MLDWTIYVSFLGALAAYLAGRDRPSLVRAIAFGTSLLSLGISLIGATQLDPGKVNTLAHAT